MRAHALPTERKIAAVSGDLIPVCEAVGIVVHVDIGVRFTEPEFVVGNSVCLQPLEERLALPGENQAEVAVARHHVARRPKDQVVAGLFQRGQLFDRARQRPDVGVGLAGLAQFANRPVNVNADLHDSAHRSRCAVR